MPALAAIGAIGGLASAGVGIASAAGAFNPSAPSQVNYGQTAAQAEQDQINLLPQQLQAEQTYNPQFAGLSNLISQQNLFGAPASQVSIPGTPQQMWVNTQTGQTSTTNPGSAAETPPAGWTTKGGMWMNPATGEVQQPYNQWQLQTITPPPTTQGIPATPGLLGIAQQAQPALSALSASANTASRTADINDVANLAPGLMGAISAYNPGASNLANTLTSTAQSNLALGSSLSPAQNQQVTQAVRQGQAQRGMGFGPSDVYGEAMGVSQYGQQLLQQRQQNASNAIGVSSALYGNPWTMITGQSSGVNTNPAQFNNPGTNTVGNNLASMGATPYSLAQYNTGLQNQAQVGGYNTQMAGLGALTGANWNGMASNLSSLYNAAGGAGAPAGQLPTYGLGGMAY